MASTDCSQVSQGLSSIRREEVDHGEDFSEAELALAIYRHNLARSDLLPVLGAAVPAHQLGCARLVALEGSGVSPHLWRKRTLRSND